MLKPEELQYDGLPVRKNESSLSKPQTKENWKNICFCFLHFKSPTYLQDSKGFSKAVSDGKRKAQLHISNQEGPSEVKFDEESRWQAAMMTADVLIWYAELWQSIILRNTRAHVHISQMIDKETVQWSILGDLRMELLM